LKGERPLSQLLLRVYPEFVLQAGSLLRRRMLEQDVSPSLIKSYMIATKLWLLVAERALWPPKMTHREIARAERAASVIWRDLWVPFAATADTTWFAGDTWLKGRAVGTSATSAGPELTVAQAQTLWRTTNEDLRSFVRQSPLVNLARSRATGVSPLRLGETASLNELAQRWSRLVTGETNQVSVQERVVQLEAEQSAEDTFAAAEARLRRAE
jgi:hypothetical protein